MIHKLRRSRQALSPAECAAVLERGTSGVLALSDSQGQPYAVPLSFVHMDDKLYFHCAKSGHKLEILAENAKASFCVIDQDKIKPEELTTYFRSVILFGTIRILEDDEEKRNAIEKLTLKYAPESSPERRAAAIDREWDRLCMLEFQVEHMSGKEAIELVKKGKEAENQFD